MAIVRGNKPEIIVPGAGGTEASMVAFAGDELRLEIGRGPILIDKAYGPTGFAPIRITANVARGGWVIERETFEEWVEWAVIPCQIPGDYDNDRLEAAAEIAERHGDPETAAKLRGMKF